MSTELRPHFRAGVAMIVRRGGDVLVFERADVRGSWQFPQGGIEIGESPVEAAWRELGEETGIGPDSVDLVAELDDWVVYQYPERRDDHRLGQALRWFVFEPTAGAGDLVPVPDGREFVDWRWVDPAVLVDEVVAFRRPAYRRVLSWTVQV